MPAAVGVNGQGPAVDGDLDVGGRVEAGKLGADDVLVLAHEFFDPERLSR